MPEVKLEPSWKNLLAEEYEKPYFLKMIQFLKEEKAKGKTIYPPGSMIFRAFDSCPLENLKVVILGQDPYHGEGEAMGLCFSVPDSVRVPPSLVNIYREIERDLGLKMPNHGNLSKWSDQGVLLMNASLTVEKDLPNSHKNIGWQIFTDAVIKQISYHCQSIVFMLWGNFAKGKKTLIDANKHLILESPHPSPLAGPGFYGNGHFSKANTYLSSMEKTPIDWKLEWNGV
jgi:uracil-DNA glycosylase